MYAMNILTMTDMYYTILMHALTPSHTHTITILTPSQDLQEEKSEWDHTMKKMQLLQKIVPDGPIPLEIFDSDVQLVKQGPLIQVVDKKEIKRMCFLFNNYFAVGESVTTSQVQYRILEV